MNFSKTQFPYFYEESIKRFGQEKGKLIYDIACTKLAEMRKDADYRNSSAIQKHMDTNILPLVAIYFTYRESGINQDEALELSLELAQIGAKSKQQKNMFFGRLPFGFSLFRLFCKRVMDSEYPSAGWDVEWVRYDKEEIHFNMKSCVYAETLQKYVCPELCPVFCANDDTVFAGYRPGIVFERNGTIGKGQEVCDFHFKKG